MSGIELKNQREVVLPMYRLAVTEPPFIPTGDAQEVAVAIAPAAGHVSVAATVALAHVVGTGTAFIQQIEIWNGGPAGAGTVVVSNGAVLVDTNKTPDDIPLVGVTRLGLSNGVPVAKGDLLRVINQDIGTLGTNVRANFNAQVIFEASGSIDPTK